MTKHQTGAKVVQAQPKRLFPMEGGGSKLHKFWVLGHVIGKGIYFSDIWAYYIQRNETKRNETKPSETERNQDNFTIKSFKVD